MQILVFSPILALSNFKVIATNHIFNHKTNSITFIMKKLTLFYLFLFTILCNLSACGDKDENAAQPSNTALLTASSWQTSKVYTGNTDITNNPAIADYIPQNCKFNTDNTFTITYSSGPLSGTWQFAADETIILTDPGTTNEQQFNIVELKENSLKVTVTNPDINIPFQIELIPAA